MELSKILTADILDILFEGRNKDYGAYELRKSYRRRLLLSITAMLSLILLMIGGYALANRQKKEVMARVIEIPDTILDKVAPKEEEKIELPKPKPIEKIPPVEMKKFTNFQVTKDEDVKPEEKPPTMDELEDTRIGTVNQEGVKDEGITAPPVDDKGTGVVAIPKKSDEDDNAPFIKVEKESEYPGGMQAWQRYLNKTFHYPQDAADNLIQGTVVIQFIVDKEGVVSDVEAISGPAELRAEAVRVIKKSGKWIPAIQNGRQVKSYKKQPIVFRIEDQP